MDELQSAAAMTNQDPLLSTHSGPGAAPSASHVLNHLTHTTNQQFLLLSHLIEEKKEALGAGRVGRMKNFRVQYLTVNMNKGPEKTLWEGVGKGGGITSIRV